MDVSEVQVGENVLLMITGFLGKYKGKVCEIDTMGYPIIQVEESGPLARLKMGDYILLEKCLA